MNKCIIGDFSSSETEVLIGSSIEKPSDSVDVNDLHVEQPRRGRKWDLKSSQELMDTVKAHCRDEKKPIDTLIADDFSEIGQKINKSAKDCLVRYREIISSGSIKAGVWGSAEDQLLKHAKEEDMSWKNIASYLNSVIHSNVSVRSAKTCKERWNNHINPNNKRGKWTLREDLELMKQFQNKQSKWSLIAHSLQNRNENSVKNRVLSLLKREKKKSGLTEDRVVTEQIIKRILNVININPF